jgi:hypothetical protein
MTSVVNQNYISNPSFTDGIDGWTGVDATITPQTTGGLFLPTCVRVAKTAEEYSGIQTTRLTSVRRRGTAYTYTASAYVKIPSGDGNGTLYVSILWYTAGRTLISESNSTGASVTNGSDWQRVSITDTPPASAQWASVRIAQFVPGNAGDAFYVDGVQMEIGSSATTFKSSVDQGEENAIINRGLTKVPYPNFTGLELNADIELDDLVFNTIDQDGFAWVITDINGMFEQPEPEFSDISRGFYADGDYDIQGRYRARMITLAGSILVPDRTYVTEARDKLVRAFDLVRKGAWLKLHPANEPIRSVFVRLSGMPDIAVVSARGRIDFSVGLKAADPVIYEWNDNRSDGYFVASTYATNFGGSQTGAVEIGNSGNYSVSAIFDVRGPIYSSAATIFNVSNGDTIGLNSTLRGERYRKISQRQMTDFSATLKFTDPHDFQLGDEITVALVEKLNIASVARGSGNTYATIFLDDTYGIAEGDKVELTNVGGDLDSTFFTISNVATSVVSNVNVNSFTVDSSSNTTAYTATPSNAYAMNETHRMFNGTQYVETIPNNLAITYLVDFRETVAQANVNSQSLTYFKNIVFRDADHLEIDTLNREVAVNGEVGLNRGMLDALTDWTKLDSGSNIIEFDDSGVGTTFVEKRSILANGIATLWTNQPHGLAVNDNINVTYTATNYDTPELKTITQYKRLSNVATITSSSHGFSNGNTVVINGVSRGVDGQYVVANATTNTFTVTTSTSAKVLPKEVVGKVKRIYPVTQYAKSNNTVTLTVGNSFIAGDPIYVTNVHPDLDGQVYLTYANATCVKYDTRIRVPAGKIAATAASANAQIVRRFPATSVTEYSVTYDTSSANVTPESKTTFGLLSHSGSQWHAVSQVSRQTNVATLTTKDKHGYAVGDFVDVSGGEQAGFQVGYGNPLTISSYIVRGNVVTATVTSHPFVTNDTVTITNINTGITDLMVTGTYTVASAPTADTFTYNIDTSLTVQYTPINKSATGSSATLYLSKAPKFKLKDDNGNPTKITVTGINGNSSSPFNVDNATVLSIDANAKSVTYVATGIGTVGFSSVDPLGKLVLTYSQSPERASVYQRNEVLYYTVNDGTDSYSTVAGNVAWIVVRNNPGLVAADTVDVLHLSSLINGPREVKTVAAPVVRNASVTTSTFTVAVDGTSLVNKSKTATAARNAGSRQVSIYVTSHGRVAGDWIFLLSPTGAGETAIPSGKYQIKAIYDANTFFINTSLTTVYAKASSATFRYFPLSEGAYAVQAYPILDSPAPTDYTFSYRNPNTTANVSATSTNTTGELLRNSDAKLDVFYRSGWIG